MILSGARSEVERQAAVLLRQKVHRLLLTQSQVVLGVVGGRSIGGLLRALGREQVAWQRVHLFLADERLVPIDHPDSNFGLIAASVSEFIAENNLHPFIHDPADEQKSLENYQQELMELGGGFDISLLSSGEDGHVASLFPEHPTICSQAPYFLLTHASPKPPPGRMSASRALLKNSSLAMLLFFGESKRAAYAAFCDSLTPVVQCPAKLITEADEHYVLRDWSD